MISKEAALWALYEADPNILKPDSEYPYDRRCPVDYVPNPEDWTTLEDQAAALKNDLDVVIVDQANVLTDEEWHNILYWDRHHRPPPSGRLE